MYRPEGWVEKRAWHEAMLKTGGIPLQALKDWRETYEAGADAMLEGLKKNTPEMGITVEQKLLVGSKSGTLVFIPEEKDAT